MLFYPFSQVLMHEFHCHYIKNKYGNNSRLLLTDTDSLMFEIKTEDLYEDVSSNKEMFDFSNYSTKSKYYDNSNKLVNGKMKEETGCAAIEKFVRLKPKMYSLLIVNSEHKNGRGTNKSVVATICHNEYQDVLLDNKCIRHSMNLIQNKYQNIVLIFSLLNPVFFYLFVSIYI